MKQKLFRQGKGTSHVVFAAITSKHFRHSPRTCTHTHLQKLKLCNKNDHLKSFYFKDSKLRTNRVSISPLKLLWRTNRNNFATWISVPTKGALRSRCRRLSNLSVSQLRLHARSWNRQFQSPVSKICIFWQRRKAQAKAHEFISVLVFDSGNNYISKSIWDVGNRLFSVKRANLWPNHTKQPATVAALFWLFNPFKVTLPLAWENFSLTLETRADTSIDQSVF